MSAASDVCQRCGASPTISSHIIPAGIARDVKGQSLKIHMVTDTRHTLRQGTLPERGLLCRSCDAALGPLDRYGKEFLQAVTVHRATREGETISLPGFDGAEVQRFVLSIIWRMSLSKRMQEGKMIRSPYMGDIENHIYDGIRPLPWPIATFAFYFTDPLLPAGDLLTTPMRVSQEGRRFWFMVLRGVAFQIRRDHRSLRPGWEKALLTRPDGIHLEAVPFEKSGMATAMRRLALQENDRETRISRGERPAII